jgi:hypothetical protein
MTDDVPAEFAGRIPVDLGEVLPEDVDAIIKALSAAQRGRWDCQGRQACRARGRNRSSDQAGNDCLGRAAGASGNAARLRHCSPTI